MELVLKKVNFPEYLKKVSLGVIEQKNMPQVWDYI